MILPRDQPVLRMGSAWTRQGCPRNWVAPELCAHRGSTLEIRRLRQTTAAVPQYVDLGDTRSCNLAKSLSICCLQAAQALAEALAGL